MSRKAEPDEQAVIVLTDPKPVPKSDKCPQCRAGRDKRVASAGFGHPHDVCRVCGYEWEELTV